MRVIGDLLRRVSNIYPDKVGVKDIYGKYVPVNTQYSWREFNEKVNRLANSFLKIGLRPKDRVAILSETRVQYFIIYQALARAGLVTVPINIAYKGEELRYLIENSEAKAVIVDGDKKDFVESIKGNLSVEIFIGIGAGHDYPFTYEELVKTGSNEEPSVAVDEEDLAMLLYTSGTTGRPKGAMLTHRNWCTSAYIVTGEWRLHPNNIFLCVLAPFFTGCFVFMTFAAARGYTLIMSDFEPTKVLETIEREKIDYTMFVPTMTSRLAKYPEINKYDLSSLKHVVTSGAPISDALVQEACRSLFNGELRFVFTYGTSETAISGCQLQPEEVALTGSMAKRLNSVGKTMLGVEIKIIDDDGNEVIPGSNDIGELVLSGDSIGKGYWGMPDNEELKDGTWYSGDLAQIDEDGYIYIVDRKKDMILSGGANIFPREIEDVLYAHPEVLHAVVIGIPDKDWGEKVHAVIVPKEAGHLEENEIINFCKQKMASYKCPKSVEFIKYEELPISTVGKVLKRELRKKYWEGYDRKGVI